MGLAASQARLLTITARLADNELRSQTINNAKMRLATQSAQASDEYVNALNSAQMMFSNTTVDGLAQSQPLTFNALTQYSQYNNQYGLVNSAGQILVSEEDAKIFEGCNNDLEAFLRAHNLEWSTTFFDKTSGNLQEKLTSFYDGVSGPKIAYLYEGKTNEELKQMYLDSLSEEASLEAMNYDILAKSYMRASINLYDSCIGEIIGSVLKDYGGNIDAAAEQITSGRTMDQVKNILSSIHNNVKSFVVADVWNSWNQDIKFEEHTILGRSYYSVGTAKTITLNDVGQEIETGSNVKVYGDSNSNVSLMTISIPFGSSVQGYKNGSPFFSSSSVALDHVGEIALELTQEDGSVDYASFSYPGSGNAVNVLYLEESSEFDIKSFVKSYLNAIFSQGSFNDTAVRNGQYTTDDGNLSGLTELQGAEEKFSRYGLNYSTSNSEGLKMPADAKYLVDFDKLAVERSDLLIKAVSSEYFKSVLNSYAVNMMLNVLGEPKYAWTDRTDSANVGNADSKAQWLTNLFNRMQHGYKVLENGLAKSSEWLEYAFESGLVTMEQVDLSQNWKSLDYKSCSNIFEQTDNSTAVAKAEAKYNRAMNDIKQKDSMFDLQLKNIDTEHNALQTEYDVIKGVINKNIERTMKFNQSA